MKPDDELAEAIAVIGMAARFPGAANVDEYWHNLQAGTTSISRFGPDELRRSGISAGMTRDPRYVPARGILGDADLFDAEYFGFTPREAEVTDPQQRLFLECAEVAFADAGYDSRRLRVPVGVFAGASASTYLSLVLGRQEELGLDEMQVAIGNELGFLATRTSYKLNLSGPSVSVQTACSTGLVAIHYACQSILDGECAVAVAGAASINFPETIGYLRTPGSIGSSDGRCRAFDADADGTVSGNGCGAVILKPLRTALRDGDNIRAVVLGSAINNDGSVKVGFTAPGVRGQRDVIRKAMRAAGVSPSRVDYVETHGTGTVLGDPIEMEALAAAYGARPADDPLRIGSVKPNIGHLDAAAGIAGFIKAVLVAESGIVPPSLNFRTPNPHASLGETHLEVVGELTTLPPRPGPRRVGISSFGVGGTNAHAIIQEFPVEPATPSDSWELLPLSAATPDALEKSAADLAARLRGDPGLSLADVAFTLQTGRRELEHRLVVLGRDVADAEESLSTGDTVRVVYGRRRGGANTEPDVAVVFSARCDLRIVDALRGQPRFAATLAECADAIGAVGGPDVLGHAQDGPGWEQPASFAMQFALARMWQACGVRPAYLVGSGIGEITAAAVAGVLSVADAATAAVRYGQSLAGSRTEPAEFGEFMGRFETRPPEIDYLSGATGEWITGDRPADSGHWAALAREQVSQETLVERVLAQPVQVMLDMGDELIRTLRCDPDRELPVGVPALSPALSTAPHLETAGRLWVAGVGVNWSELRSGEGRRRARLPGYPFQRRSYTLAADVPSASSTRTRPDLATPFRAPEAGVQASLVAMFEAVLGVAGIGITDSLLELGGDSLMATRVLSRIHEQYGVELSAKDFLRDPTVSGAEDLVNDQLETLVSQLDPDEVAALLSRLDGVTDHG
ncbi:MAG TPA: beta-ketoacyl synthase N-terminal-like domain-containing protein [Pseudonocardiaceae bacterium]|jgi:acyl transferase domain-containing protein|nr:beta-ketoacyl synthase N-terminal-like domain-containing protein [Pseudonocardiaceae bacterium]